MANEKILGFRKIDVSDMDKDGYSIAPYYHVYADELVPVVSLEWLEKELEKAHAKHMNEWLAASRHGLAPCDCLVEGREEDCEVTKVLDTLLCAAKKESEVGDERKN